jgi:hypothetical protein
MKGYAMGQLAEALQDRRSRVRFPMVSLEYFVDIIHLAALWPLGSTQPLMRNEYREYFLVGVKAASE